MQNVSGLLFTFNWRLCGAKTRAGTPCKNWAMANGRCRMHGGKSTGPKTEEGKRRIGKLKYKHGRNTRIRAKRKHLLKHQRLWRLKYGRDVPKCLLLEFWKRLKAMPWKEFTERRKQFMIYYRKQIKYLRRKKEVKK